MKTTTRLQSRSLRRSALAMVIAVLALLLALLAGPTARADAVRVLGVDRHFDITYYNPDTPTTNGNKLDLYIPVLPGRRTLPLLIWTSGSAWLSDNGRAGAAPIADVFTPYGYAVAGVSVRSSSQDRFPGQLHDIRAAIRWLREHAADYNLDPDRFAIMGNSSGGWVSAITATTSDVTQLPGEPDVRGTSSAVQAAVPFFPPTDFLRMDSWYVDHPEVPAFIRHDAPLTPLAPPWTFPNASPESLLVRCTSGSFLLGIQSCPAETKAADPITYIEGEEVPMLVLHGESDPLVPNGQSVLLYEALADAGNEVTFVSVADAGHSVDDIIGAEEFTVFRTYRGGWETVTNRPAPTWENIEDFLHLALRRARGG
jgi:acetyl esterase/lipase